MKFIDFVLTEMFKDDNGYKINKNKVGSNFVFDLSTGEARDYRMVFTDKENGIYIAELGYQGSGKDDIIEIKGEFYNADTLLISVVNIFTGFYMSASNINTVIYKFQHGTNKSYKILVDSLFKKELKNYYTKVDLGQKISDYGSVPYIIINSNKGVKTQITSEFVDDLLNL